LPSTTFADGDGRSRPKSLAISKNLNNQPAPKLPKHAPKPDRCTANGRWHNTAQGGQKRHRLRQDFALLKTFASERALLVQGRLL